VVSEMSCTTRATIVEVAVRTLIKEIVATYEARRGKRRALKPCTPCAQRDQEAQP